MPFIWARRIYFSIRILHTRLLINKSECIIITSFNEQPYGRKSNIMSGLFQLTVMGFTTEVKVRTLQNGKTVTEFSVAQTERWTSDDGTKHERTNYARCTFWNENRQAFIQNNIQKGMPLMVVGTARVNAYKDKNGEAQGAIELNNPEIIFVPARANGGESRQESTGDDFTPPSNMGDIPF